MPAFSLCNKLLYQRKQFFLLGIFTVIRAIIFCPRRALEALVMDSLKHEQTDYLIIGHITQDIQPDGTFRLGGTTTYSGLTAKALGAQVNVLTSASDDVDLEAISSLNINCHPSEKATVFRNIPGEDGRLQYLYSRADQLKGTLLPEIWANPAIVHIAPVIDDVDPEMLSHFPNSLVCLTPQGWMRHADETGLIHPKTLAGLEEWLGYAQIVILSIEDIQGDMAEAERLAKLVPVLVLTQREKGALVFWQNDYKHFPAPKMTLIDDTGSGDIFAACFFYHYFHHQNAFQAATFAVDLASRSVTREWLDSIPKQEEIHQARKLALEQALYG